MMSNFQNRKMGIAGIAAFLMGVAGLAIAQQPVHEHKHDHTSVLSVRAMQDARYVAQEILKIPGVGRVVPDYKKQTLTIIPRDNAFPSPRMIWDAADRAKIQPVRLATAHGNFNARPLR
jgi:hypothetical protein